MKLLVLHCSCIRRALSYTVTLVLDHAVTIPAYNPAL